MVEDVYMWSVVNETNRDKEPIWWPAFSSRAVGGI